MATLLEHLHDRILIGDGAMGSYLHAKGVPIDAHFEELNLTNPHLVQEVHSEYLAAGARVLETNTYGANRNKLARGQIQEKTREINLAGARIAREICPRDAYVLGSVGPVGRSYLNEELNLAGMFREQMLALAEGGVDALILETFSELEELKTAVRVARNVCDLPVIAQMAFFRGKAAAAGGTILRVVRELESIGANVIGGNCGPGGPSELSRVLRTMATLTEMPISAFPNASFPNYVEGRFIYVENADYFADIAFDIAEAGANLIGGCCGTTPTHIRRMAERLASRRPTARMLVSVPPEEPKKSVAKGSSLPSTGRKDEGGDPFPNFLQSNPHPVNIIVEVDPPRGLNIRKALRVSRELAELGANAVSIADNQLASIRMSSFVLSHLIQQESGITAICHCACRDRNLLGQQSELMGASVLGVRHILAITGDPVTPDGTGGSSVFDTNSFGLIDLLSRMNRGENTRGESISHPTRFVIGGGVSPNRARMDGEIRRLEKKVALGATFAMTQPPESFRTIAELREKTRELPVEMFLGILPLVNYRNAEFLHNEVPGIKLSEDVRQRMKGADNPEREGVEIAKEQIDAALEAGFRGIYIIPMLGKYEMAYRLVEYVRGKKQL